MTEEKLSKEFLKKEIEIKYLETKCSNLKWDFLEGLIIKIHYTQGVHN